MSRADSHPANSRDERCGVDKQSVIRCYSPSPSAATSGQLMVRNQTNKDGEKENKFKEKGRRLKRQFSVILYYK